LEDICFPQKRLARRYRYKGTGYGCIETSHGGLANCGKKIPKSPENPDSSDDTEYFILFRGNFILQKSGMKSKKSLVIEQIFKFRGLQNYVSTFVGAPSFSLKTCIDNH
jgi:hypothetical protein